MPIKNNQEPNKKINICIPHELITKIDEKMLDKNKLIVSLLEKYLKEN